jgi:hypothetical protein
MEGRISLAPLRSDDTLAVLGGDFAMDASVATAVRGSARAQLAGGAARGRDKSERATVETVLDPRTRLVRSACICTNQDKLRKHEFRDCVMATCASAGALWTADATKRKRVQ